jgi:hypothetical protein
MSPDVDMVATSDWNDVPSAPTVTERITGKKMKYKTHDMSGWDFVGTNSERSGKMHI